MLKSSIKYAFLVSANEVMFLKFDAIEKVEYDTHDDGEPIDLFVEPWLHYSTPIKFSDVLDEANGTVSVKLALMYLLHCSMQGEYELQPDISNSANCTATTKAGENYVPKLSFKIGERLGKY
jgi:hypothetical protein